MIYKVAKRIYLHIFENLDIFHYKHILKYFK